MEGGGGWWGLDRPSIGHGMVSVGLLVWVRRRFGEEPNHLQVLFAIAPPLRRTELFLASGHVLVDFVREGP